MGKVTTRHRSNRQLEFKDAAPGRKGQISEEEEFERQRYVSQMGWNGGPNARLPHLVGELIWKKDWVWLWRIKLANHKSATKAQMAR